MKNKIIIAIALLLLSSTILIFDSKIFYRESPINENLSYQLIQKATHNPTCGVRHSGFKNYAFIMPALGEKVEILSVEKSRNIGIDVVYKIVKLSDVDAVPVGKQVEFINLLGSPVGFVLEN